MKDWKGTNLSMQTLHEQKGLQIADRPVTPTYPWWRLVTICLLFLLSVIIYILLIGAAPHNDNDVPPFLHIEILSFIPYLGACAFVLATKPVSGRWRWIEIGIILLGALVLRAMLLPLSPSLSRDSWRYLWDARVTLHGFSPYVYAPFDKALVPLRDTVLLPNSRFRTVPTIYPPGAQGVFLLSYLLAGANLFFLKGIFLVFDMVTCIALVILLGRKGLDQRRVILYAWCPLPIIEFAVDGHVDVITLTFTILAVLAATNTSLRGRMLTGFLIGLATLTKIYPILLLVALVPALPEAPRDPIYRVPGEEEGKASDRATLASLPLPQGAINRAPTRLSWEQLRGIIRYNAPLFIACFVTILLGYVPYLILGHGQVFGYFATYASEQGENAGVVQQFVHWLGNHYHLALMNTISLEHSIDFLLVCAVSLSVFVLRLYNRIGRETAVLLLFGVILSISSHVFPWYTTTLLLWVPVLLGPLWQHKRPIGRGLAIIATWYFTLTSIFGYFFKGVAGLPVPDWTPYYNLVYWPVVITLIVAAIIGIMNLYRYQKGFHLANHSTKNQ
jgi:hypothetical protein